MRFDPGRYAAENYPDWRIKSLALGGAHAISVRARRTVFVERTLSRAQWDESVAHEFCHMDRDDEKTVTCWHERKQEQACWRDTARLMIGLDDLVSAWQWVGPCIESVAEELGRTSALVRVRLDALHPSERGALRLALSMKGEVA